MAAAVYILGALTSFAVSLLLQAGALGADRRMTGLRMKLATQKPARQATLPTHAITLH